MWFPILALLAAQAAASPAPRLPTDAAAGDWHAIPDDDLLVVELDGGHDVVIRLASRQAPEHVANVRTLARAHWWDAASVYRVQENWVTQWGDVTEKKPLPPGVAPRPSAEYDIATPTLGQRLPRADAYSSVSGLTADGWSVAGDGRHWWLTHCYGSVGVARDAAPDTGTGAELFTPIGQSARRLDRNYTIVGQVIEGMAYLSALPRGTGEMGFYKATAETTPIVSARLASDLPAAARPHFQYRATDNPRFAALLQAKLHPAAPTVPTGLEVCDVPMQVRRVELK